MTATILVAEELRDLLGDHPLSELEIRWIEAGEATPAGDYVAVIPLLTRQIGARELSRLPKLRIVANCAVGVDNVDLAAARERHIVVTNTPDVLTDATADLTWALILAVARRLKEGQQLIERRGWTGWHPTQLLGRELRLETLGIIGAGRIGQAVGRRGVGFGMRLLYTDRSSRPDFECETGATRVDLAQLLAESDVISLHVPSTAETVGMLTSATFRAMKRVPLIINTARGDLLDESALLEALESGHVGGAGLDVFAQEPHVDRRLVTHPNVVVLPHIGSATTSTRKAMATLAADNVVAVLAGAPPVSPVNT